MVKKPKKSKSVESLKHKEAKRRHIPTAELQAFVEEDEAKPKPMRYPRNPDLDPQLVWRSKDEQDGEDLIVDTVPIYIQEKIQPQAIIDDIKRRSDKTRKEREEQEADYVPDLFADFNGLVDKEAELEFYAHDKNWSNRMILGDSLLVMNSLAEKEALKGQVQCIFLDPPYGIKFNSNWQASTKSRDVKDGKAGDLSREPEMIRAFRDTWSDKIHSYLTYLRDRLMVARELLHESGSIFIQIGDENLHLVRSLMDEVFGANNFVSQISFVKTSGQTSQFLAGVCDYVIWYAKKKEVAKFRPLFNMKIIGGQGGSAYTKVQISNLERRNLTPEEKRDLNLLPDGSRVFRIDNLTSQRPPGDFPIDFKGTTLTPKKGYWKTGEIGMRRLKRADRIALAGRTLSYVRFFEDFRVFPTNNLWVDTITAGFASDKLYVVQTLPKIVERCIQMASDPGDLVLDPTCGSGTTAYVAEQWGRRWITIDTSRVALALARQRLMSGRFPGYLLIDSQEGARREAEITGKVPVEGPFHRKMRQGFVYERAPHIMLKSIANNAEIDVIWETWQETQGPLLEALNAKLEEAWEEWEVPREAAENWSKDVKQAHAGWWKARCKRQEEIDAAIARNAEVEFLYDRPYKDKNKVRVTGPFTVESLSPHRVLSTDDQEDELLEAMQEQAEEEGRPLPPRTKSRRREEAIRAEEDFTVVILDNLKKAGVHNTKKGEDLKFTELKPWPGGDHITAEGRYEEGTKEKRVAVFIGPEYGQVSFGMVRQAAREALDGAFDTLVLCGFAFEPRVNEEGLAKFPGLTVLKAHMNSDLHMAEHLRSTGAGHLFVVFGEPDIKVSKRDDGRYQAEILGVDIFDPTTGEVRSSDIDDIACWFVDTDYDEESFFVRQAYFLGGNDPYKKLKTTLKAEIDAEAWETLYSDTSRPFDKPETGKIAVKVINHYGDEVLKVYDVG